MLRITSLLVLLSSFQLLGQTTISATGSGNTVSNTYSTNSGLSLQLGINVEYLIVGGGGGGGTVTFGGGGGGGGVLFGDLNIISGSYTISVGSGGSPGNSGSASSALGFTAVGGGGGGNSGNLGQIGGSGGGNGCSNTNTGAAGTSGQGSRGGAGYGNTSSGGGGGGGATAIGTNGLWDGGGNGGAGYTSAISGTGLMYGTGGGGGGPWAGYPINSSSWSTSGAGMGGWANGGGGNATPGVNGRGGGGGGASNGSWTAGSGGSGIVVIRYKGTQVFTGGTITSITVSGQAYTVHTFSTTGSFTFSLNQSLLSATISGIISGSGNLEYLSSGTLNLSATNTYTGTTTVSAGRLNINGNNAAASGAIAVQNNAILGGTGTIGGSVSLNTGATLAPGVTYGILSSVNNITLQSGSTFQWELLGNTEATRGTNYDGVNFSAGNLTIQSGVNSTLTFNSTGSTVDWTNTFWDNSHNWLVFDNVNTPSLTTDIFETITETVDRNNKKLTNVRAGASFFWYLVGNDIYLGYMNSFVPALNGGNTVTNTYTTGTVGITLLLGTSLDYLLVGGGGGGGTVSFGGGGGGGGVLFGTLDAMTGSYTVKVGSGGTAGNNGDSTTALGLTAYGGGSGGKNNLLGSLGGSGGGNGYQTTSTPASGISGQGNSGGAGISSPYGGGGGGGATAAGQASLSGKAGDGGAGYTSAINGNSTMYGSGGGGGGPWAGYSSSGAGMGGWSNGGGGNAVSGTNGTGGGGGGASNGSYTAGAGGSGIVIVRYKGSQLFEGGTTSSITVTGQAYTVHAFSTIGEASFNMNPSLLSANITSIISGSGPLSYSSPGTLTLSGTNTYTGTTTITNGCLNINGNHTSATGNITVQAGATLGGSGTINSSITVQSKAAYAPGAVVGIQTLNQGLTLESDATFNWNLNSNAETVRGSAFDGINVNGGTLTIQTGVISKLIFNGAGSQVDWSDAFWTNDHTWLIFDDANPGTLTSEIFSATTTTADKNGKTLSSIRAGAGFYWFLSGNDIYLGYKKIFVPAANGGRMVSNNYSTDNGGLTIQLGIPMEYLIVGGGGGGGNFPYGGGGGGGGVIDGVVDVLNGAYSVLVGNGGTAGNNGGNSSAFGITAYGGGSGNGGSSIGSAGGSGGGNGWRANRSRVSSSAVGQGFSGGKGSGISGGLVSAGGGGGAAGIGGDGAYRKGGDGGAGLTSSINGTSAVYGGGGGGGGDWAGYAPSGAGMGSWLLGGGGTGGSGTSGRGGGGGGASSASFPGQPGGSGTVIIRYQGTQAFTGGNVSALTVSGITHTLHTFTSIGSSNLTLDASSLSATITGIISGSGSMSYNSLGTLILNSNNTYTGNTSILAGTLQIGNNSTTGSLSNNAISVSSGATLLFNRSNTIALGGSARITGAGNVTQSGSGTLDLGGISNHEAGTWKLSSGTISNGTMSAGNFTLENGIISAVMAGTGSVTKNTSNTVTLSGSNTYSGNTAISAGTLIVNGTHSGTGTTTVASSATLKGNGSLTATTINGTHSPGSSPGLQTFVDGLTYNSGSQLNWELNGNTSGTRGTDFDAIDVTGGTFTIQSGVSSNLIFNTAGSAVDWTNSFWNSDHSWLVFDNTNTPTTINSAIFSTVSVSNDINNVSLNSAAGRKSAYFYWSKTGNDIYLNYVAIAPAVTWTGSVSTDWGNPANWSPAVLPSSPTNVTIPNVTNDPVVTLSSGDPATANDVIVESGALLTISSGKVLNASGNVQLTGNLSNAGTLSCSGTLTLDGSSAQTLAGTLNLNNLTINNNAGVTLNTTINATSTLTMTSGNLTLGSYNATFTNVTGGGSLSYVKTSGSGQLNIVIASAAGFTLPVGNSAYNPVTINNNTGSTDNFSVRVMDVVYYKGLDGAAGPAQEPHVTRTWIINKTNPNAGSGIDLTFGWNVGELSSPAPTSFALYAFNGGTNKWDKLSGSSVSGNTLTYTGYTGSVGLFAIGDDIIALPLPNLRLKATVQQQNIIVDWTHPDDRNLDFYALQYSTNARQWKTLMQQMATGKVKYKFVHVRPEADINYYRIIANRPNRETDTSQIVVAVKQPNKSTIYPNPSIDGKLYCNLAEPENAKIFNSIGKFVWEKELPEGTSTIDLRHLSAGYYYLRLSGQILTILIP